ncbi:cardiolipin synthase [Candidatus Izimaplasma bacterium ZiA1]|uniref:cardiolipin synthase n=1 Tax=Candidatus Izimoplasma sp. ZiA1 TaxID=2024899 RepID=UPI000BAA411B|nr:cardiolipin synthase [Candidatus Izimaplasma bacterium ZiA1]
MRSNYKRIAWIIAIVIFGLIVRWGYQNIVELIFTKMTPKQYIYSSANFITTGLVVLIWIGIVSKSEYTPSKLPWLIFLAFEPFIGLMLFLTFGRSFRNTRRYSKHPLIKDGLYLTNEVTTDFEDDKLSIIDTEITDIYKVAYNMTKHSVYQNNSKVEVLNNGKLKFNLLEEDLLNAKSFIFMQYYIIKTDKTGRRIMQILSEKAKEGLEVILMYDPIGSVFLDNKVIKGLKKSGVKVIVVDKVYFGFFNSKINYRNHRKMTIIDSNIAYTGGMNLGDEYQNINSKYGVWRDTHLRINGEVINSLTALFFRDYYYATSKFVDDKKYYQARPVIDKGLVQVIPSGPEFNNPPIRNVYVKMINNSKKSIKIMTPYLALDNEIITSLIIASNSGVDVKIIIPGIPDKKSVYQVTESFVKELLDAGVRIYKYTKGFCHAKVFIVDDNIASCGTYNLDNRSARINSELTMLMHNNAVDDLVKDFENDINESLEIDKKEWGKRGMLDKIIDGVFNLFSPLV